MVTAVDFGIISVKKLSAAKYVSLIPSKIQPTVGNSAFLATVGELFARVF